MHRKIDGIELDARDLGGDDDAVRPAPDVDRRKLRRRDPSLIAEGPIDFVLMRRSVESGSAHGSAPGEYLAITSSCSN